MFSTTPEAIAKLTMNQRRPSAPAPGLYVKIPPNDMEATPQGEVT
jgi:hypothetical protein